MRRLSCIALTFLLMSGCMTTGEHRAAIRDEGGDRLTAGKVQREIKVGMSTADVVEVLGSPNLVSTDDKRREVWVYDKISTENAYSTSTGGISALILGGAAGGGLLGGGLGGGSYNKGAGASSTTHRTLTVIIQFDEQAKVRDFAYRQSSF